LDFISAYALTITIETIILYLLLRDRYGTGLIVRNSLIASSLTLPFVWFVFPWLGSSWAVWTAMAELFAFGVEAGIYMMLFERMGWKQAVLASFICNSASFVIGSFL